MQGSDGAKGLVLACENRPVNNPYHKMESPLGYVSMNGQEVYKFAVRTVPATITKVLEEADLEAEEISLFVLHQLKNYWSGSKTIETADGEIPGKFDGMWQYFGSKCADFTW